MTEALEPSLIASLIFAFAAGMTWWGLLRFLDLLAGGWKHFKNNVQDTIHSDPRAAAQYYGCRAIAAAILVGLVLSSVRY